jgi:putative hydrolase of the HAD superfamily
MQYETIFFDLDHTLWDFETNSRETLVELSEKYNFRDRGIDSVEHFIQKYLGINERMWEEYGKGLITKDELRHNRFHETLRSYNIDDFSLAMNIGTDYSSIAPYKPNVLPYTIEVLEYLSKKYPLYIITNGFEEVQHIKMKCCKIDHYFSDVITSERSGFKKPDKRMFDFSFSLVKAKPQTSIMIGDSLHADVLGAKDAGMSQVYFNPKAALHSEEIHHEIRSLNELMNLL